MNTESLKELLTTLALAHPFQTEEDKNSFLAQIDALDADPSAPVLTEVLTEVPAEDAPVETPAEDAPVETPADNAPVETPAEDVPANPAADNAAPSATANEQAQ